MRPSRRRPGGGLLLDEHRGGRLLFDASFERELVVQQPVVHVHVVWQTLLRRRERLLLLIDAGRGRVVGRGRDAPVFHEKQNGDRQPDGASEHQSLEQCRLAAVQVRRDFHRRDSVVQWWW